METIVTEIIEILKSNNDIIEREKQLHAYVGQVACQLIATAFRHIDDALWEEHRQEGARSKRRDARTLVTLYGEVTIPRRLVQTADGRNLYPLDQFLGVAPRSRLSPLLQYVVANVASKTVYRTTAYAVNMLSNATISHAQVGTVHCSPTPVAQPTMKSSISLASMPVRLISSGSTLARSSSALKQS